MVTVQSARGEDVTAEAVNRAIERGVDYLKREQTIRGAWNELRGYPYGQSSLAALALLNAGVKPDDPHMQRALDWLRGMELDAQSKTYTVSLQTMALCAGEPKKDLTRIQSNVRWLEETQLRAGAGKGSWGYPGNSGDNSNAQFATLALHEAERVGIKVKQQTWKLAYEYWKGAQNADGSWGYKHRTPGTGSMTCAGIAGLVITSGKISSGDAGIADGRERCCGGGSDDDALDRGLAWLARNFSVTRNPRGGNTGLWHFYYLYGLERAGRLTAQRFIGEHDWYREGAEVLLEEDRQDKLSGFWKGSVFPETDPIIGTSKALLFLSKGRRPVVVSKLRYGDGRQWNRHRQDLANLTTATEQAWERDLTWQVIDADRASVEDLLQTPVLFISGSDDFWRRMTPGAQQKLAANLREYLNRGGFLFADACCGGGEFDAAFRKLMNEVFPEPEYKLGDLPAPDHPVWRAEKPIAAKYVRSLEGIEYGCRTCVVYAPPDRIGGQKSLSCYWELSRLGREANVPAEVEERIEAAVALGVNVLTYATNREPKYKNPFERLIEKKVSKVEDARATLYIAKLKHPGGCNAAPGALMNLLRTVNAERDVRVSEEDRQLEITDRAIFRHHMLFMHGRHQFQLTPEERKQLAMFLERGGTLFSDSICASAEFSDSFRKEIEQIVKLMEKIVPEGPLARIPTDDPIFSDAYGGYDIRRVERRDPTLAVRGQPLAAKLRQAEPDLEGLIVDGRYAVIFSPYDISCALERQVSLECNGYVPKDAARIGVNVILYSLHR